MIKRLDPYHLTAGFTECGELHAFQEPHLSLDAPIRENYRPEMAYHHNDGSAQHPGSDGSLRMPPMTFEPVFNGLQAERQAVPEVALFQSWRLSRPISPRILLKRSRRRPTRNQSMTRRHRKTK